MQNRVNPFGEIIETKARGAWMGNRGLIHNKEQKIVRSFKLKAWITCRLAFKGRKRTVMTPNLYTELFFLDEATAFAAGHRPCFECRREAAFKFKEAWLKANPKYGFTAATSIQNIDTVLHEERTDKHGAKKTYIANNNHLPDGTFIATDNEAWLVFDQHLYLWTPQGYTTKKVFSAKGRSTVLTPKSIVNAFKAGYAPQISIGEN